MSKRIPLKEADAKFERLAQEAARRVVFETEDAPVSYVEAFDLITPLLKQAREIGKGEAR